MKIVLLGAGEVGQYLAHHLSSRGEEVVVVDLSPDRLRRAEEDADALTLCGDATHRSVLREAQVHKADLVVALTGRDEVNVVAAALAAQVGAERSVARVDAPSFYSTDASIENDVLGIHSVLCASRLVSEELLRGIDEIHADSASYCAANTLEVARVPLGARSPFIGKNPSRIELGRGVAISAVMSGPLLHPSYEHDRLEEGDAVVLSGTPEAVSIAMLQVQGRRAGRRAVIVGGGDVGLQLAQRLQRIGKPVQIIEADRRRCEELAAQLPGITVVHGDGTSIAVLQDQRVDASDYLVAVTRADEVNLMAALMARDLGVTRTFALVHRPGYAHVYRHLGISGTAGPHLVIGEMVDWLLPRGEAMVSQPFGDTGYALCEKQIPTSFGRRLERRDLALPSGALVLGVVGADGSLEKTDAEITAGATIVLAVPSQAIKDTDKALRTALRRGRG
ncbi:MAG: Trk system potassium transporter TrkA [Myxococcales bacterium]|nr:Trk system potassium transporter TrkA [Myxococcales bacterium]